MAQIQLNGHEARVLGVLIEKALTTPEQYPLSLNAVVSGANQKNNRDPVLSLSEDEVFDAVESLREKQLAVRVDAIGSRVHKYKHTAGETLRCRGGELAILAELLVRGPQTLGELRGRASRMSPLNTLDDAKTMIRALSEHAEPLVKEIPPAPGSRAERYVQLLAPDAHPIDAAAASPVPTASAAASPAGRGLADRVAVLESEVATLRAALQKLAASIGEPDPLGATIPPSEPLPSEVSSEPPFVPSPTKRRKCVSAACVVAGAVAGAISAATVLCRRKTMTSSRARTRRSRALSRMGSLRGRF